MLDLSHITVSFYTTFENFDYYNNYFKHLPDFRDISDLSNNLISEDSCWYVKDKTPQGEDYFFYLDVHAAKIPMFDNSDIVIFDDSVPSWIVDHYIGEWYNEKHDVMLYGEYKYIDTNFIEDLKHRVVHIYYRYEKEEGY